MAASSGDEDFGDFQEGIKEVHIVNGYRTDTTATPGSKTIEYVFLGRTVIVYTTETFYETKIIRFYY